MIQFKSNMANKLLVTFTEWMQKTSLHGISSIFRTNHTFIRIMYGVSFLFSLFFLIYMFYSNCAEFLSFNVNTQIHVEREAFVDFPSVTFYNLKPININKFNLKENLSIFVKDVKHLNISNTYNYLYFLGYYSMANIILNMSTTERSAISYTIDDMLLMCKYNSQICNKDEFRLNVTFKYGNCYSYNTGYNINGEKMEIKKIINSGRRNGLKLELFVDLTDPDFNFQKSNGIHLLINNQNIQPIPEIDGIDLPIGYETDVVVTQTVYKRLSYPYSNCIKKENINDSKSFDYSLFKETFRIEKFYSQNFCYQICYQRFITKICGCRDGLSPRYNDFKICTNMSQTMCAYTSGLDFFK